MSPNDESYELWIVNNFLWFMYNASLVIIIVGTCDLTTYLIQILLIKNCLDSNTSKLKLFDKYVEISVKDKGSSKRLLKNQAFNRLIYNSYLICFFVLFGH